MAKTLVLAAILTAAILIILTTSQALPIQTQLWEELQSSATNPNQDANEGIAFDLNHTKITIDGNIMPTGEIYVPDEKLPAGGLVGYWKLDENAATVAVDSSGLGNHGTWMYGADSNGSWFFDQNAGWFSGTAANWSRVDTTYVPDPRGKGLTAMAWVKWNYNIDDELTIISTFAAGDPYFEFQIEPDCGECIEVIIGDSSGSFTLYEFTDAIVSQNTWHHIAFTYDGVSVSRAYVDGVQSSQIGTHDGWDPDTPAGIVRMGHSANGAEEFRGYMGEVKLFDRALSLTEIANEYRRSQDGNGLVGYWNFNDTNGSGGIADEAGWDQNGLLVGGADINAGGLWDTNAANFDGADDYLDVNGHADTLFDNNSTFSWTGWIQPNDLNKVQGIIGKGTADTTGYAIIIDDTNKLTFLDLKNLDPQRSDNQIEEGTWTHFGLVYDNGGITFYKNGTQDGTGTVDPTDDADNTTLGLADGNYFEGYLDEIKYYNVALTEQEIQHDYNSWAKSSFHSEVMDMNAAGTIQGIQWDALFGSKQLEALNSDVNLLGWWRFNDDNSAIAKDHSKNGYHGTFINGADANGTGIDDTNAFYGDGVNDQVNIDEPALLDANFTSLTISLWFKKNDTGIRQAMIGKGTLWYLAIADSTTELRFRHTNLAGDETDVVVPNVGTTWHHAVATYDGTETKVYLDGILYGTGGSPGGLGVNNTAVGIGASSAGGSWDFHGLIDEVRIYGRALNQSEINTLYAAGLNDLNVSVRVCDDPSCQGLNDGNWAEFDVGNRYQSLDANVGLVLDINFNDTNSDGSGVIDASWNLQNGLLMGGMNINVEGRDKSRAGLFDGVDDMIHITDAQWMDDIAPEGSMSAWVYPTSFGHDGGGYFPRVLARDGSSSLWTLSYNSSGVLSFGSSNGGGDISLTGIATPVNTWTHLAVTWKANEAVLYQDGVRISVDTTVTKIGTGSELLTIGNRTQSGRTFQGRIDNVKMWNRALTQGEVQGLYIKGSPMKYVQYRAEFEHTDANYPIGYGYLNDVALEYNRVPDVNVGAVEGYDGQGVIPWVSYAKDSNVTIDFNVFDWDGNNGLTAELFYSTNRGYGNSTKIQGGLKLTDICTKMDFNTFDQGMCNWDWNISGITDGNYYIGVTVIDSAGNADFNFTTSSIKVNPTYTIVGGDINVDTIWLTGVTYVIDAAIQVENSATLTIQPGAIVKYKDGARVRITGGAIVVIDTGGSDTNKVQMTSCKDQTVGENTSWEAGCNGLLLQGDYDFALFLDNTGSAGDHSSINWFDLNISFAQNALNIGKDLNSLYDCNIQDNNNMTLNGQNGGGITIIGATIAAIYDNSFTDNYADDDGGAIVTYSDSTITNIYNNTFTDNNAGDQGGGIYVGGAITNIYGNTFTGNTSLVSTGGGILYDGDPTSIYDNNFIRNFANTGGGIYVDSGNTVTAMYNNIFQANEATQGGGIIVNGTVTSLYDNNFTDNVATTNDGGGIRSAGTITNLYSNTFTGNDAAVDAGAISIPAGTVTSLYSNTFAGNTAGQDGGAIEGYTITNMYDNNFANNTAGSTGGAIRYDGGTNTNVYDNNFTSNTATAAGGGGFNNAGTIINVYNNRFITNTAVSGGGITSAGTITNIYNNIFTKNNTTSGRGGAIHQTGGLFSNVYNNSFTANTSTQEGGAIYNNTQTNNLYNNVFISNASASNGDAIFNRTTGEFYDVFNNVFAYHGDAINDDNSTSMAIYQNNIFVENTTAMDIEGSLFTENYNAFWSNDTNCSGKACGANDVNFTAFPFIGGNTLNGDLNWVIIDSEVSKVTGAGTSTNAGSDAYFQKKTVRPDNQLDKDTRDIGYHQDQNAIYVQVVTPNGGQSWNGTQTIDFNVSADINAWDANVQISYSTTATQWSGTPIITDQNMAETVYCDNNAIAPEKTCHYKWDTTGASVGTYFILVDVNTASLSGFDASNASFTIDNSAPTTRENVVSDGNSSWQNTDANIQLNCTDNTSCKNLYYSLDDVNYQFGWGSSDSNRGIVLTTDANHEIFFWSDDSTDNNEAAKLIYLPLDKTAPTVTITDPTSGTGQTATNVTITYSATYANSDVNTYWVKADTGNWIDNGTNLTYTFSAQTLTAHTYYVKAQDNADNNSSEASVAVTISAVASTATTPESPGGLTGTTSFGTTPTNTSPTPTETIEEILEDAGFSQTQITQSIEANNKLNIQRLITVEKESNIVGVASYKTTVTILATNQISNTITGVRIIENIPKGLVTNQSQITSGEEYTTLKENQILEFAIDRLEPNGTAKLVYIIHNRVTETENWTLPIAAGFQETVLCQGTECPQQTCKNPRCNPGTGLCNYSNQTDGTRCGQNGECEAGTCKEKPLPPQPPTTPPAETDLTTPITILGIIGGMVAAGLGINYFRGRKPGFKSKRKTH